MKVLQINQQVKAVTPSCETCGGPHSYNDCPATVGQTQNVYAAGAYQGGNSYQPQGNRNLLSYHSNNYLGPPKKRNYMKANDAILKNMQTNMTSLTNSNLELKNMFGQFMKMNTTSSSGSRTLSSNTITNPKEDLKGITTRSGTAYHGPTIPITSSSLPKVVERKPSALKPNLKPSILYPSRLHDQKLRDKANDQKEKIFQIFKDLDFNISFVDALILMPKFGPTIKSLLTNKDKLFELARTPLNEHCSTVLIKKLPEKLRDPDKFLIPCDLSGMDECLALAYLNASINPLPLSVWNKLFLLELTPTLMTLELADRRSFLETGRALIDVYAGELTLRVNNEAVTFNLDQTSRNVLASSSKKLKICEAKNDKSSIDEPLEVELKDLPPHLEYAFLEGDDKFPVIIAKDLSVEEKAALIKVLKSHKQAIAWKLFDIKGINPEFCTHKLLMEDDFEPVVQNQRRVIPKIHDVIKKEVLKLLDAGLIYPISDSPWVSPVHCVPKNGGFTVVENEGKELIPTQLVTGWHVCIDCHKLNEVTLKDHFPLPFMDQMLERLARNEYFCFLNGFSDYFQIPIDPKDQEKITFTCPYGTFAYRRMPFGLCNAPGTFQRCMMAIFHDMIEKMMEIFMNNFSVFGNSFRTCLSYLEKMLK
nr:reverse transcriptase domain-containing protein [Tanacetum cinerariifolium]